MARIGGSARHLLHLIDQILSFSRIEARSESVHLEEVDLNEIAAESVELMRPLAEKKRLAIELLAAEAPLVCTTDSAKVRQIIFNLLSNAVKFTDRGGIRIATSRAEGSALIAVQDTGVGIAREHRARIFEPFRQVESTHTRKVGGTGLGLSVSRGLAILLDGSLDVESEPGAGSTFTLRLPCR